MTDDRLLVFPTGRAIRAYEGECGNRFLPTMVTAENFFQNLMLFPARKRIPKELRALLLSQACEKVPLSKLGFQKEFVFFIEHSDFLFHFFDELAGENIALESLRQHDVYAEYEDHLEILESIKKAYEESLAAYQYIDRSIVMEAEINSAYLERFSSIEFFLEGYLTRREIKLLSHVASQKPFLLHTALSRYSHNIQQKLESRGILLSLKQAYTLDLSSKTILKESSLPPLPDIQTASFSRRILQVNFIFYQLFEYIQNRGISPEKIAIILPSESFVPYLRLFDSHRNLNYAMGKPLQETRFFQALTLIKEYFATPDDEQLSQRIASMELDDVVMQFWAQRQGRDLQTLINLLTPLLPSSTAEREIIDSQLYSLHLYAHHMTNHTLQDYLLLFLRLLGEASLDDISGGRIRVMGVLETRGLEFDAIIMPDMNEGIVPKASDKDIFLNSKLRRHVGLPTRNEREELQKHFYLRLLQNTKHAALCWVQNDESEPSPFLSEIGIPASENADEKYRSVFFKQSPKHLHWDEPITLQMDLASQTFSHSRLKTLLECRRKYYYHYICKLQEPDDPDEPPSFLLGKLVHDSLQEMHTTDIPSDISSYQKQFSEILLAKCDHELLIFDANLLIQNLEPFIRQELQRREEGYRILAMEDSFPDNFQIDGIRFTGFVDRIDILGSSLEILDYKLKENVRTDTLRTYQNSADFQLVLYQMAIKAKYPDYRVDSASFYDLKNGTTVPEMLFEEKKALLHEKITLLKETTIEFTMQDEKPALCRFCPYRVLCNR